MWVSVRLVTVYGLLTGAIDSFWIRMKDAIPSFVWFQSTHIPMEETGSKSYDSEAVQSSSKAARRLRDEVPPLLRFV